jgi:SAM-dependent methyltransferase
MNKLPYNAQFFAGQKGGSLVAAQIIVPIVLEILQPTTVVDVGCGVGTWPSVFRSHGLTSVMGVDGGYVDTAQLMIPADSFRAMDLAAVTENTEAGTFDFAMSLEVAEHLPQAQAPSFVRFLTRLAPSVMFGAAIPGQGGNNHVNEQWPSYWISLFLNEGFRIYDVIRPRIWHDSRIPYWYRQNTLLFLKRGHQFVQQGELLPLHNLVHPDLFSRKSELFKQAHVRIRELEAALRQERSKDNEGLR